MKRKGLISLLLFAVAVGSAATREELLSMVDSAYHEAVSGRLQQAVAVNMDGLKASQPPYLAESESTNSPKIPLWSL